MLLMECFSLGEHVEQGLEEKNVQTLKKTGKKRSQEDKIGRLRYHEVVTKRVLSVQEQILSELRWIRHRLKALGESDIDVPMLEKYAVKDQVDLLIMERVRMAGDPGVFPKDVAAAVDTLGEYNLRYYDVSRRIIRMNKRLHFETGDRLFEKRGHRWALTRFGFDVYGATEAEAEDVRSNASDRSFESEGRGGDSDGE